MPRVPDVRQKYSYDCGPACAVAVARAFGRRKKPAVRCSTRHGTYPDALAAGLDGLGFATHVGRMDGHDLLYHLRRGRVVVAQVLAGGEGHWVVVWGASRGGSVSVQDPDTGPRREPFAAFVRAWLKRGGVAVAVGPPG